MRCAWPIAVLKPYLVLYISDEHRQYNLNLKMRPYHMDHQNKEKNIVRPAGVGFAVLAAVLFGGSAPFAKLLLGGISPVLLAGLLYLGSGLGLTILYFMQRKGDEAQLK